MKRIHVSTWYYFPILTVTDIRFTWALPFYTTTTE
jgi:hypothetical protein